MSGNFAMIYQQFVPRATAVSPAAAGAARRTAAAFDRQIHKRRDNVERCSTRRKQWRGIATRHDKTARSYQAAVLLASLPMRARPLATGPED
jgi:transposase